MSSVTSGRSCTKSGVQRLGAGEETGACELLSDSMSSDDFEVSVSKFDMT